MGEDVEHGKIRAQTFCSKEQFICFQISSAIRIFGNNDGKAGEDDEEERESIDDLAIFFSIPRQLLLTNLVVSQPHDLQTIVFSSNYIHTICFYSASISAIRFNWKLTAEIKRKIQLLLPFVQGHNALKKRNY